MSNVAHNGPVLQASGLTKRFHEGRNIDLTVLRGVDLAVQAGEKTYVKPDLPQKDSQ